jgi:N6-adenosine-specific RNA methylase IME4
MTKALPGFRGTAEDIARIHATWPSAKIGAEAGMNILPDLANLPLALRVEISENAFRKSLTQSELAAQQAIILEVLRRQNQPGRRTDLEPQSDTSAKVLAEVNGRPTEIVGRMFGESHAQIEKRLAIMRAAEAAPERFGKLVADMDRTGRVDGPFKRLKVARQAEAIRAEPPPYPGRGPYRVIVADPPWPYELRKKDPSHRATHPYPQMSIAEICAESEKVKALAHEDCILWLWTTNHHMREAFVVLDAWGFEHKTILTWAKDRFGTGDWLRGQTEHCLFAVRGKPIVRLLNQSTLLPGPLRKNSQKPEEFYALVERLCPTPRYCELFARRARENWDGHGDEYVAEAAG